MARPQEEDVDVQTTRTSRTGVTVLGVVGLLLFAGCTGSGGVAPTTAAAPTATSAGGTSSAVAPTSAPEATGAAGGAGANGGTGAGGSGGTGATGASTGGGSTRTPTAGCTPDGTGVPAGVVSNQTIDVDGDGKADTEWIQTDPGGQVLLGITTASGATFGAHFSSASPIARSMLVADATGNGEIVALASDGRQANLFVVDGCHLTPATNVQGGQYTFDLGFGSFGTGIGCSQLAGTSGRQLVGLKLNLDASGKPTSVDSTVVQLDGTRATNGPSNSIDVRGRAASDPAVTTAREITCGTRTLSADGVRQPN